MLIPLCLYGAVVFALLITELREDRRAQYFFKPLAAMGFVLLAVMFGALETAYGQWILAGLVACALGDVLLLSRKSEKLFLLGMAAFGIGHILYSFGIIDLDLSMRRSDLEKPIFPIFAVLGLIGAVTIIQKAQSKDRISITIYSVIIISMIVLAAMTENAYVIFAALLFAVSDFFVGLDRFIKRSRYNALAITPLYFGAQALFALSAQV